MTITSRVEASLRALEGAPQQQAVLAYICRHPHAYTHEIARSAGCMNVPDTVARIRDKIRPLGLTIVNYLPPDRPKTRHGTTCLVHRWKLVEMGQQEVAA